jgi:Transposase DDE domain
MLTSKSPRMVAMVALATGKEAFSDYSHIYSPHKFTQPQLFACLVLKEFEKKDYRGITQLLADWPDLRNAIGLRSIPHFTTLQKASRRLLKLTHVRRLLGETIRRIHKARKTVPYAAADSSGFDAHHASRYFIWRRDSQKADKKRPKKQVSYRRYGKLMVIVSCISHAILAAVVSHGPTPDIDQLDSVVAELPASLSIRHMVLDAGFDSAHNHQLLREKCGILSTIPPEHGRPPKDPNTPAANKYRRLMQRRFREGRPKVYGKRSQVETVISMMKRNLGAELRAKTVNGRHRDMLLRALTHNIALALLRLFYRALPTPYPLPYPLPNR